MNKREAIAEMRKGKQVVHTYFLKNEYITMVGDDIVDENNIIISYIQFWENRHGEIWDSGWSVLPEANYNERLGACTCGVPYYLHGTCCGWKNANLIIEPENEAEVKWQKMQMEATGCTIRNGMLSVPVYNGNEKNYIATTEEYERLNLSANRFTKEQIILEVNHILDSGANKIRLLELIEKIQDDAIHQGRILQHNIVQAFQNGKKELERTVSELTDEECVECIRQMHKHDEYFTDYQRSSKFRELINNMSEETSEISGQQWFNVFTYLQSINVKL